MLVLTALANDGSGNNHILHLYVQEKDPRVELWEGARSGTQAAVDVFNADEVRYCGPEVRGRVLIHRLHRRAI